MPCLAYEMPGFYCQVKAAGPQGVSETAQDVWCCEKGIFPQVRRRRVEPHLATIYLALPLPLEMCNWNQKPTGQSSKEELKAPIPAGIGIIGCSLLPIPFPTPGRQWIWCFANSLADCRHTRGRSKRTTQEDTVQIAKLINKCYFQWHKLWGEFVCSKTNRYKNC